MDHKELIKRLRAKDRCNCECLQAATVIETLLAEQEAERWINVKDRLPEETGIYLVNIHQEDDERGECGDFVIEAWYQKNGLLFAPEEVGWILLNEWYDFTLTMRKNISHWMPFPAPPDCQQTET